MKYFVSYTTIDNEITRDFLNAFSKALKSYGEVFIDILDNDSDDRQSRIFSEIDCCDRFILIESKSIGKSKWVKLEIERALTMQIPIKRISYEKVETICFRAALTIAANTGLCS